jgi:hypothetical protein
VLKKSHGRPPEPRLTRRPADSATDLAGWTGQQPGLACRVRGWHRGRRVGMLAAGEEVVTGGARLVGRELCWWVFAVCGSFAEQFGVDVSALKVRWFVGFDGDAVRVRPRVLADAGYLP